MKTKFYSIVSLVAVAILLGACGSQAEALAGPGAVESKGSLMEALRAAGATITIGETIEQPFFSVEGQIVKVNGADVQVFEYESAEAMEAEAALVAPDGGSVGTSAMMWMAPPHFFKSGRVLVLYLGEDSAVLGPLEGALGEQFAGQG